MNEYKGHPSISTNEYKEAPKLNLVIGKNVIATATDDLPTAEEYKESMESMFKYSFNEWSEPKYQCSECGGGMCRNEMVVCASYPPKYEYRCNKCGHVEYQRG